MGRASERCALRRKQELILIDVDMFDAVMATVTEPPRYFGLRSRCIKSTGDSIIVVVLL
jgi:hypothetical protein